MLLTLTSIQDSPPIQTEKTLSLLELIQNGGLGGQLIIGLLFVLSLVVVYIYFERLFARQKQKRS